MGLRALFDITRKSSRSELKPRREPYWLALAKGCALGFRRGPDTWVARYTKRDGSKVYHALKGSTEYHDAKKAAEEWLASLSGTAVRSVKRGTVRSALERYLKDLRTHGRQDTAEEAEGRFKVTVFGDPQKGKPADPIAELSLESATRDDFDEWRERLRLDKTGKPRQPRSINRHVRAVVAGLNRAHALGHVGKPEAWQLTRLADDREDDGDTAVFLDAAQRKAIVDASDPYLAEFLRGLGHTGARPKELAAVRAGDFDGAQLRLQHRKGRPAKLRTRYVVLDGAGVRFFSTQAARKLPGAFLFTQDGQRSWTNHDWARAFQAAVSIVNASAKGKLRIPVAIKAKGQPGASAYSFRHARISELLQVHGIDPLTVAHQTGTSVAVIEKTYFKFIPSAMREKLAAVNG
jgi:integrase